MPCKQPSDVIFLAGFRQNEQTPIKDKLRYVRLMAGLKQVELADLVGIERSTLNRLENGVVAEENMKTDLLVRIAIACGVERTFCCNRYHEFLANNCGDKIKKYRKERQMTQQALADVFGVHKKTVGEWEQDRHKPPIDKLKLMFPEWFCQNE